MARCSVILTLHALTQWNVDRKIQGHIDTPLNETGHRMASALCNRLRIEKLTAIYSSDLRRAIQTAEPIADMTGLDIQTDPRLREKRAKSAQDTGEYPLLPFHKKFESWEDVESRMVDVMEEIAIGNPDGCVLVVSHGGATRFFIDKLIREGDDNLTCEGNKTARMVRWAMGNLIIKPYPTFTGFGFRGDPSKRWLI